MTKDKIYRAAAAAIFSVAIFFLAIGCEHKDQPAADAQASPPRESPQTPELGADGNLEKPANASEAQDFYRNLHAQKLVNPLELPAYIKKVQPLVSALSFDLSGFATTKEWFIAPIDLVNLNQNALSVTYSKSGLELAAVHTTSAVWIDERHFSTLSTDEQAYFLLNELLTSVYLTKFESVKQLCENVKLSSTLTGLCGVVDYSKLLDFARFSPAALPRQLEPLEQLQIRKAVDWIFASAQAQKITNSGSVPNSVGVLTNHGGVPPDPTSVPNFENASAALIEYFAKNGFDPRIFPPADESAAAVLQKIRSQVLFEVFRTADLDGKALSTCESLSTKATVPCALTVQPKTLMQTASLEGHKLQVPLPALVFDLKLNGTALIEFVSANPVVQDLVATTDELGEPLWTLQVSERVEETDLKAGKRIHTALVFLRSENSFTEPSKLVLDSIILKTLQAREPDVASETAKVCEVSEIPPKSIVEDTIFIYTGNRELSSRVKTFALFTPSSLSCR